MIKDVLAGDSMLAMVQPMGETADDPANPPIYPVACLGAVTAARQSEDGRYYINLTGVSRFRIVREMPLKDGYRRAVADYADFATDLHESIQPIGRDRLMSALTGYLTAKGLGADWSAVAALRPEPLIATLAMACPLSPSEKQAILESPDLAERARVLTTLLEMASLRADGDTARH
ncbi:MAG: LON peptidase substrate-binding domain-containing protein, partial [Alphaproteobacteria bacterium]